MVAPVLRRSRRRDAGRLAAAAVEYAAMGWPVCGGAHSLGDGAGMYTTSRSRSFLSAASLGDRGTGRACSCDRVGCPAPGAHPISAAWQIEATSDPVEAGRYWLERPDANVILATGRVFDVLDVPAAAGAVALGMMRRAEVEPGPVAAGVGDRALFFVTTRGAPHDEGEWWSCQLDCEPENVAQVASLRWHCRNSYVLAPPSRGATAGARWLRPPGRRPLPDPVRMLEFLADACEGTSG
jgi:Bifunctional DNA primase/polymerase, N-terminal